MEPLQEIQCKGLQIMKKEYKNFIIALHFIDKNQILSNKQISFRLCYQYHPTYLHIPPSMQLPNTKLKVGLTKPLVFHVNCLHHKNHERLTSLGFHPIKSI